MNINDLILLILTVILAISAIDYIIGSKFGLGKKFQEAFQMMGSLALIIVGIMTIAPLLAEGVYWFSSPVYQAVGIDPAALINTILALDMGGHALAMEVGESEAAAVFAWVFIGTMYGPTITFTVPIAFGMLSKEDRPYFTKGILLGLVCAPLGCLAGGLTAGLPLELMLLNLVPALFFSCLTVFGLTFFHLRTLYVFTTIGQVVTSLAVIGIVLLAFDTLLPFTLVAGLTPLAESMSIIGQIVLVLAGALPLVHLLSRLLERPLARFGNIISINGKASAGLMASLAHTIPAFSLFPEMNPRGKTVVAAFCVSGAFVFGGHLGFVAGVDASYVFAMIVGKLTGGVCAILLAVFFSKEGK
ncbi:ethanolamine utilization protein EutH [Salsuginibacillus kocurii]|uniref:ethanolamine utilization protein EutH n=1 Tax=Salsuginibacillus kocurii TaxID=427078 RepID=UPI0003766B39|nr:ethanolamine utilization protein EutH [Salsuginibacillus kocurii]